MTNEQHFGNLLKSLRKKEKLTQDDIAKVTGLSIAYVGYLEQGRRGVPSMKVLEKLASALEVDYIWLLGQAGYSHGTSQNMEIRHQQEFGNFMQGLRGNRKQAEVAQDAGISVVTLSNMETGTRIPKRSVLLKLAATYGVCLDDLTRRAESDVDISDLEKVRNPSSEDEYRAIMMTQFESMWELLCKKSLGSIAAKKFSRNMSFSDKVSFIHEFQKVIPKQQRLPENVMWMLHHLASKSEQDVKLEG